MNESVVGYLLCVRRATSAVSNNLKSVNPQCTMSAEAARPEVQRVQSCLKRLFNSHFVEKSFLAVGKNSMEREF